VTTSYVSPAMRELDEECKKAGITVINEVGLDPGIDHLWAVKAIEEVHKEGGKIRGFYSWCGGLPAPEDANNPLGYKFSWSPRGVLLALLNTAKFISESKTVVVSSDQLMESMEAKFVQTGFTFIGYPNRDSTGFAKFYDIEGEVEDLVRGTLRYEGFREMVMVLRKLGLLDDGKKDWLKEGMSWAEITAKSIGLEEPSEHSLIPALKQIISSTLPPTHHSRALTGLHTLSLTSSTTIATIRSSNLLDTFCALLESKCSYQPDERDMVVLQHTFEIETSKGEKKTRKSTLIEFGEKFRRGSSNDGDENQIEGISAMSKLVGVPCGIAVQLVLDGELKRPGVHAPYESWIVEPLLRETLKEGIEMKEEEFDGFS